MAAGAIDGKLVSPRVPCGVAEEVAYHPGRCSAGILDAATPVMV